MNKQLINKYKHEFDHWLNEGSVLIKSDLSWCPIAKEFAWSCTTPTTNLLVINDEFVELRKALAEGKTIQLNEAAKFSDSNKGWKDLSCTSLGYSKDLFPVDYYRIKPNEPKFKVGDFVRYVNSSNSLALEINNINCGRYYFVNSNISCLEHELIPWEPIKDEWCWFWDITNEYSHLSQFNSIARGQYQSSSYEDWYCCEPFLNSKPSYLRDK